MTDSALFELAITILVNASGVYCCSPRRAGLALSKSTAEVLLVRGPSSSRVWNRPLSPRGLAQSRRSGIATNPARH